MTSPDAEAATSSGSTPVVVVDAEVDGRPGCAVRIEHGRITWVGPSGPVDRRGAAVLDARGGALLPGLHDHHLHLLALAARLASIDLGAATTPAGADALLAEGSHRSGPGGPPGGWVRAAGYDEAVHGPLDRTRLDRLVGPRPVRVQHRSGLGWVVSTAGLQALGLELGPGPRAAAHDPGPDGAEPAPSGPVGVERDPDGVATGWLHRLDRWLGDRVGRTPPDLVPVARRLSAYGITGVTDTTPVLDDGALDLLLDARCRGDLPQRLMVLGRSDPTGLGRWAELGPRKLVADEAAGLDVESLTHAVRDAHAAGRAVAVHCATRAECVAAVVALAAAGPVVGDRLEHAFVLPPELDGDLAAAGTTVVAQPLFVEERGDHYLDAVDPSDHVTLHRLGSLLRAGVPLALSSDAPVAGLDPWAAMVAATRRRTARGVAMGPGEALTPAEALAGYLGPAAAPGGPVRRIVPGAPADLCLLRLPLDPALASPSAELVAATLVAGEVVHRAQ